MIHDVEFSVLFLYAVFFTSQANYDPFADTKHYSLSFPGPLAEDVWEDLLGGSPESAVVLVTKDNERYRCFVPEPIDPAEPREKSSNKIQNEPEEVVLLRPLYDQSSCSYKIEPYWTYELCHGKFLRQYHEEKEGTKDIKLQEYYLGNFKNIASGSFSTKEEDSTANDQGKTDYQKLSTVQVGGQEVTYYEVMFDDGTACDVTGHPRRTSVRYVCHELGRGEIYELKETSSCEYEVVVLTQLLCEHPKYRQHKDPINQITCHPLEGAPHQPVSMKQFEIDSANERSNKHEEKLFPRRDSAVEKQQISQQTVSKQTSRPPVNKQLLQDFLAGEYCVSGGSGWWKHRYCHGKKVTQYHEEKSGKTEIKLGVWDEAKHLEWIKNNPVKQPKTQTDNTRVVYNYYTDGDICELTGKPRTTEVRLKCVYDSANPNAVSLYLLEPKPCEYNLVVQALFLCPLIENVGDDGIMFEPET